MESGSNEPPIVTGAAGVNKLPIWRVGWHLTAIFLTIFSRAPFPAAVWGRIPYNRFAGPQELAIFPQMAIDPICQMQVDEATALRAERDGQTYYFCCESCRRKFLAGDRSNL